MQKMGKIKEKIAKMFSGTSLRDSSFASDVLKLVGGTAIAQALGILASPVITRLYGPKAFGVAALFTAITGIISV